MNSLPTRLTAPARRAGRPLAAVLALVIALAGLVSVATPAQAAEEATFVRTFAQAGSGDGATGWFYALAKDADGRVYAADYSAAVVKVYSADGEFLRTIGHGHLSSPYGAAVDAAGNVHVTESSGRISTFDPEGALISSFHVDASIPFQIAASGGHLFVTDVNTGRVLKLTLQGEQVGSWGNTDGPGQLNSAFGIATRDGYVYVADLHGGAIRKYDTNGTHVADFTQVSGRAMAGPYGVSVDSAGRIAVAELYGPSAAVLDPQGRTLVAWGSRGTGAGQFQQPTGISLDDTGRVYVADFQRSIQQFELEPTFKTFTPTIQGSGRAGDELSVTASTSPEPASWTYAWTVGGSDEVRSTAATFTPTLADVGEFVTVTVTAKGVDGEPADRSGVAQQQVLPALMTAGATLTDSTPTTPPTSGDVLTVVPDESKIPEGGRRVQTRWGHLDDEQECVTRDDFDGSVTYDVSNADAGRTICVSLMYLATGYDTLVVGAAASDLAVGAFTAPTPTTDVEEPRVGETVTAAVNLDDAPEGAEVTAWQWGLVDGEDCAVIEGADEAAFTPEVAEFEKSLCVTVTVSAPHHADATTTHAVGEVGAGDFAESPAVSIPGWVEAGVETTATVTGGDPADAERAYQWNLDGEPIDGATQAAFTPKGAHRGHELSVTVTSSARGFVDDVTTSDAVEVGVGTLRVPSPQPSSDRPRVGEPISLPIDLSEAPEEAAAHWQWGVAADEDCVAISGATSASFTPTADLVGKTLCVEAGVTAEGYEPLAGVFVPEHAVVRGTLPAMRAILSTRTPKVGTTLTAPVMAGVLPEGASTTTTWGLAQAGKDCRPVTKAGSYRVTSAMAGREVCVRVTVTAPGYVEWSTTLRTSRVTEIAKASTSRTVVRDREVFTVRAQGLAPGQRYRISLRHQMVTGKADSHGRVVRKVRYGKGLKSAKRTIVVRGFDGAKVTYLKKIRVTHRVR
ncbi:hypothetical protein [Aeromicrobium sp. JJY06]|uniref:hypothetical protein n=1 Tax=Aeromicrobium sp. JJY06 TaxID=3373478 RepID=UPI00376F128F